MDELCERSWRCLANCDDEDEDDELLEVVDEAAEHEWSSVDAFDMGDTDADDDGGGDSNSQRLESVWQASSRRGVGVGAAGLLLLARLLGAAGLRAAVLLSVVVVVAACASG